MFLLFKKQALLVKSIINDLFDPNLERAYELDFSGMFWSSLLKAVCVNAARIFLLVS